MMILAGCNKIAFQIGEFGVAWYAILIMLGAALAAVVGHFGYAKKIGLDSDTVITGITIGVLVGILGARLYYVLFNFQNMEINSILDVISPRSGGLAIHGGIFAELIFLPIFCKVKKIKLLTLLEIVLPVIMLAQVVGRWGNFINQEAFGSLVPFSGEVVNGRLSDLQLLEQREYLQNLLIPNFVIDNMYITSSSASGFTYAGYYHPTFLYESVFNLIGFISYTIIRRKVKKVYVGDGLCFYLTWYGLVRFFIELLRTDPLTIGNTGIRVAILISISFFVIGITLAVLRRVFKWKLITCEEAMFRSDSTIWLDSKVKDNDKEEGNTKVVIFDCDGTLVDTFKLIEQVVIKTFEEILPDYHMSEEEAHTFFGPYLPDSFKKYLNTTEEIDNAVEVYRKYCDELLPKYIKTYDGIDDMLKVLKEKGYKVAVVSNKISRVIYDGFDICNVREYFDLVVGAEMLQAAKPDPDGIYQVMKHYNIKNTVLVGDTFIDMETAKNANIHFIGVTWCQVSKEEFINSGVEFAVNKPSEILDIVEKIL